VIRHEREKKEAENLLNCGIRRKKFNETKNGGKSSSKTGTKQSLFNQKAAGRQKKNGRLYCGNAGTGKNSQIMVIRR